MARARKKSDDVYNARRRLRRQAERLAKKAENATGATKGRYDAAIRELEKQVASSYQDQHALDAYVKQRAKSNVGDAQAGKLTEARSKQLQERSLSALQGSYGTDRDAQAAAILRSGNIGSRFYAGLKDIWQGADDIDAAILDAFGATSLLDVLDELEDAGIDIYQDSENEDYYNTAALSVANYVMDMGNAA